jgi:hypothetical protein
LVGRATDSPTFYFELRFCVIDRAFQDVKRLAACFIGNKVKGVVDNTFCGGSLTSLQNFVDYLGDEGRVINWVGRDFASGGSTATRHFSSLS